MSETPNVVIENPQVRRVLVVILGVVAIITACAAIVLGFWPELSGLQPDPTRIIATVNAIVSFLSGAFGLGVTLPNIPKTATAVEADGFDPALPESEPRYAADSEAAVETDAAPSEGNPS